MLNPKLNTEEATKIRTQSVKVLHAVHTLVGLTMNAQNRFNEQGLHEYVIVGGKNYGPTLELVMQWLDDCECPE